MMPQRLAGEAILRVTPHARAEMKQFTADNLTGIESIDEVLRNHRVASVQPAFSNSQDDNLLNQLFEVQTESDEDLDGLIAELRDHPDVEEITPRYPMRSAT